MLERWNHQGKFAEDYVRALASAAGLLVYKDDVDHDGVDLGFRYPGKTVYVSSPAIEVQVKSWSAPRYDGGDLCYRGLNEVQYNKLVDGPFLVPRYLFLVVVPLKSDEYAQVATDGTMLGRLCYFRGFDGEAAIDRPSVTRHPVVRVSLGNVLTVQSLLDLVGTPAA